MRDDNYHTLFRLFGSFQESTLLLNVSESIYAQNSTNEAQSYFEFLKIVCNDSLVLKYPKYSLSLIPFSQDHFTPYKDDHFMRDVMQRLSPHVNLNISSLEEYKQSILLTQ